jgi:hypothetical protein
MGKQNRDSIQQSMRLDYTIGSAAPTAAAAGTVDMLAGSSGQARQLLAYLYQPVLSPWLLQLQFGSKYY